MEIKTQRNYVYEPARLRQYNCRKEGGGGEGWSDGKSSRKEEEEAERDAGKRRAGDVAAVANKNWNGSRERARM